MAKNCVIKRDENGEVKVYNALLTDKGKVDFQITNSVNFSRDEKLNTFLNQLNNKKGLAVNPFNSNEFIYGDNIATIEINRFDKQDENEVVLQDIFTVEKGVGNGKKTMQDIVDVADTLNYKITLDAKPFGNIGNRLEIRDLVNFYSSFGFEVDLQAYGGEFNSKEEFIEYAEENPSEAIPMFRESKKTFSTLKIEDVKMKKAQGDRGFFDGEYDILDKNGNIISSLYFNQEDRTWRDPNYTGKYAWDVYGDLLGYNKKEALEEAVNRHNKKAQDINFQIIGEKGANNLAPYKSSLEEAKRLESQGVSANEIEARTRWYKYKGSWKMLSPEVIKDFYITKKVEKNKEYKLKEVLKDENIIFKIYPQLGEYKVIFVDTNQQDTPQNLPENFEEKYGAYNEDNKTVFLNTTIEGVERRLSEQQYTLAHEVSHIIQEIEGFPKGGIKTSILTEALTILNIPIKEENRLVDLYNQIKTANKNGLTENEKNIVDTSLKTIEYIATDNDSELIKQYRSLLGEVDASIVEGALKIRDVRGLITTSYLELLTLHKQIYNLDENSIFLLRNGDIRFQITEQQDTQNIEEAQEVLEQLKKTGLANNTYLLSNDEITAKLVELGVDADAARQVVAYHGSPYSFNKFTTDKIGTGEGAQAFGWGLYFTDLESIAKHYAESLSKQKQSYLYKGNIIFGEGMYKTKPNESLEYDIAAQIISDAGTVSEFAFNKVKERLKDYFKSDQNEVAISKLEDIKFSDFSQQTPNKILYKVSLHQGKTPDQYTWLEWDKPVNKSTIDRLIKLEEDENLLSFPVLSVAENGKQINGDQLYNGIVRRINDNAKYANANPQKEASLLLLRAGIDGVKYPAESVSRGATSDTARGFNYVVFDENAITIEEQVQFQKQLAAQGIVQTVNGFTINNDIYLNKDATNLTNTSIHEYSHVYLNKLKTVRPEFYNKGLQLAETKEAKDYIEFVKRMQPDLVEGSEKFKNEVLAQIIGDSGERIIKEKSSPLTTWLNEVWDWIKGQLGLLGMTNEQVANMTLQEYADKIAIDLLKGDKLFTRITKEEAIKRNNGNPLNLAPNGKPSILYQSYKDLGYSDNDTDDLVAQVYSDNFKNWFGDSKVVDSNGQPLIVYHGSAYGGITTFNREDSKRVKSGLKEFGTYFTTNKKLADFYQKKAFFKPEELGKIDNQIYKLTQSLYTVRNNKVYEEISSEIERLKKIKSGSTYPAFLNLSEIEEFDAKGKEEMRGWQELEVKASYKIASNRDAMEFLKDGLFGVEKKEGVLAKNIIDAFVQGDEKLSKELIGDVYLVFDGNENQIKSATENIGTFDSESNDIRFQILSKYRDNKRFKFSDLIYPDVVFKDITSKKEAEVAINFYKKIVGVFNKKFNRNLKLEIEKQEDGNFSIVVEYETGLKPKYFAYPTATIGQHEVVDSLTKDVPLTSLRHELIHEMLVKHITDKFERINNLDQSATASTIDEVQRGRAYNYTLEDVFFERVVENIERLPDMKDTFPIEVFATDVVNRINQELNNNTNKENVLEKLEELLEGSNPWLTKNLLEIFNKEKIDFKNLDSSVNLIGKKFKNRFDLAKNVFDDNLQRSVFEFTEIFNEEYSGVLKRLGKLAKRNKLVKTKVPSGNRIFNEPLKEAKVIAEKYMAKKGIKREKFEGSNQINKDRAKAIATLYYNMKNDPTNEEVKKAYEAMTKETLEQYDAIILEGYTVEVNNSEPYSSSDEMIKDLRDNKNMKIFSTESGFGDTPITEEQRKENPLLARTPYSDKNGVPLLVNDVFRFVHDFFGHAELGNGFGAIGEENAWNIHARMFSPLARRAMTSETRGQNSWVNFSGVNDVAFKKRDEARRLRMEGKIDEAKKLIEEVYEEMSFAEQKIGLLPEWVSNPNADIDSYLGISPKTSANYANLTEDGEGNFVFFHKGSDNYKTIKPASGQGTKTSREEASALAKVGGLAMYYTKSTDGEVQVPYTTVYAVKVPKEKVYDFNADILNLSEEAKELHEKEHKNKAFDFNSQLAYVTKVAYGKGFDMVVAKWGQRTRAQSYTNLTPYDTQVLEGNTIRKFFKDKYVANSEKGWVSVEPKGYFQSVKEALEKISSYQGELGVYNNLYHLRMDWLSDKVNEEQALKMIEDSTLPEELKNLYREALKTKNVKSMSVLTESDINGLPACQ